MVRLTIFVRRKGLTSRAVIHREISIVCSVSLRNRSCCTASDAGAYNTWQLSGIAIPHYTDSFKPFFMALTKLVERDTRHAPVSSDPELIALGIKVQEFDKLPDHMR